MELVKDAAITVGDFLINGCLEVSKDKIKDTAQEKAVRRHIEEFMKRQEKLNFQVSLDEEIDFEALADYLCEDLLDDLRLRLRGNKLERGIAHFNIMSKVKTFARAKTKLGEKRAMDIAQKAIDIWKRYYRNRINADLLFLADALSQEILDGTQEQHDAQVTELSEVIAHHTRQGIEAITAVITKPMDQATMIQMGRARSGDYASIESDMTDLMNALSTQHSLYPDYGLEMKTRNGKQEFRSVPRSAEAAKKYPPKIRCVGTAKLGDKTLTTVTPEVIDYANRHQMPLIINITGAQKMLGSFLDPIQHEAEEYVGQEITIPPKPFPKPMACSIAFNDNVVFDYILLRTKEILDDDTLIFSNDEQSNIAYRFTFRINLQTQSFTVSVGVDNANNEEMLRYVQFMKQLVSGGEFAVKSLEHQAELARGKLDNFHYEPSFDSIEEEEAFFSNIVDIEKYYSTQIAIPKQVYENAYNNIAYLAALIRGETNTVTWSSLAFNMLLSERLRTQIESWDDSKFCLTYVGTITVPIFEEKYELPVMRRHISVKPKELPKLKAKARALDIGEEIRVAFLPGEGTDGIWEDYIYLGEPIADTYDAVKETVE